MREKTINTITWIVGGLVPFALVACGPSAKQRAEDAEKTRIECSDKICQGDVEPKRNVTREVVLKLNGQWYIGPKKYFASGHGAAFYWPGKTAAYAPGDFPPGVKGRDFYDVAIEIFLTGRQRWPQPSAATPWDGSGWEGRFDELQKQGWHIERQRIQPDLERVRFFDVQGKQYRHEYFLATQQRKIRGNGAPGVACDQPDPRPNALPRCTGGMFWQEDVYADFRFHAKHAGDWPAIHQEIVRVINLARKAQP